MTSLPCPTFRHHPTSLLQPPRSVALRVHLLRRSLAAAPPRRLRHRARGQRHRTGHDYCDRAHDSKPQRLLVDHTREAAAVDGSLLTPGASGITAPSKMAAVLRALPLLAIPFLPPPVAALVALSSLASRVSARFDDCFKLNHATCTIYPYDNGTNSIDRTRPNRDLDLGAVCLHPLCHADSTERLFSVLNGQRHGRGNDILHIYCIVSTLEGDLSILPWRNTWRVHLPVADPGAAAASGANICYIELAHLDYREGYYIHCPAGEHHQTYCTEFPEEAIAAAVWEHRRLNYRATAGPRYATYQQKYKHDEL